MRDNCQICGTDKRVVSLKEEGYKTICAECLKKVAEIKLKGKSEDKRS